MIIKKIQRVLMTESGNVLVKLAGDAKNKGFFTYALKKAVENLRRSRILTVPTT